MNDKIVIIPQIDAGVFPLHLPAPNAENSGGYIYPSSEGKTLYGYSPIDYAIAAIEAQRSRIYIEDLTWFFSHWSDRLCETELVLGILRDDLLFIRTICYWKYLAKLDSGLNKILVVNAPLTMRY